MTEASTILNELKCQLESLEGHIIGPSLFLPENFTKLNAVDKKKAFEIARERSNAAIDLHTEKVDAIKHAIKHFDHHVKMHIALRSIGRHWGEHA